MNRFEFGSCQLIYGESRLSNAKNVRLYDGDTKVNNISSVLMLTLKL